MSVTLTKADGLVPMDGLVKMSFGVSWTPSAGATKGIFGSVKRKVGVDLDAVAVLFAGSDPVRFAGWDTLDPIGNGAVTHSGDNLTGAGEGDDETITVTFDALSSTPITSIMFLASAFKRGSKLNQAANVAFNVYTQGVGEEKLEKVAEIWPPLDLPQNTVAVTRVIKTGTGWGIKVLNSPVSVTQGKFESILTAAKNA